MDELGKALSKARQRSNFPKPAQRRLLREQAGLTLRDVARPLGVSEAAVSRYETGLREPRGELRDQYLKILERLRHEAITAA
jgi:transcriptional regulator with XRE-family HTH domain